jgi:hypothetical protein
VPVGARTNYLIYAALDYANHRVEVDELIAYPNQTGAALNGLTLVAEPNLWLNCFNIQSVTVNGAEVKTYSLASHQLQVILPGPLMPGETATLGLTFALKLPQKSQEQIFGYSASQTNLVHWFPFVAPYDAGAGWLIHEPWAWGEHLVYDAADFEVNLKIANPDTGVIVAASAPAEPNGEWTRYRLQKARTFALSASPYFITQSGNVGGIAITSYFFEGHEQAGSAALSEIGLAVNLFISLFGKPPYKSLSIVETYFLDGMEFDGLIYLSRNFYDAYDGTSQNNLTTIGVHETAHQWWFGMVGSDQALEPWLDEALATYSERLFYENTYPGLVSWWWNYRVRYYEPVGYIDTSIYNGGRFRTYTNQVYLVGAYFLEALRQRIGDEAFFAFLRDYAAQMSQRRATEEIFSVSSTSTSR